MTAIHSKASRSSTISTTPKISPSTASKASTTSKPSESSKTDTPEPGVRDDASFPQTQDMPVGVHTALRRAVAAGAPGVLARMDTPDGPYTCAMGVSDTASGARMQPDLRFRIGGVANLFLSVLVMQLVDEGIDLDAPVRTYLSDQSETLTDRKVTVRQMISHPDSLHDRTDEMFTGTVPGFKPERRRLLPGPGRGFAFSRRPSFRPASTEHDGGPIGADAGLVLAGRLVEAVTGRSLAEQYETRIIRPLALTDTSYDTARADIEGPHARGHLALHRPRRRLADVTEQTVWWAGSAGATVSSARDLNTFLRALLSGRLLSGRSLAAMLAMRPSGLFGSRFHGLGISRYDLGDGPSVYGHTGTARGYTVHAFATGDGSHSLTVMANTSNNRVVGKALGASVSAAFDNTAETAADTFD